MHDSTFMLSGSTTTHENPIYKAVTNLVSNSDAGHRHREQSRVLSWQEQEAFEDSDLMRRAHTWPTR